MHRSALATVASTQHGMEHLSPRVTPLPWAAIVTGPRTTWTQPVAIESAQKKKKKPVAIEEERDGQG